MPLMVHLARIQRGLLPGVEDLLTAKQLQDLLQVDRITIYRMLNDGRLRGFKVGGQWRFSRREINAWLQEQRADLGMADSLSPADTRIVPASKALPLSCVQAIQDVCAEALDLAAVTTDLNGIPLTEISNSCDFCSLILSTDEGRRRCEAAWKSVGNGLAHLCHAGLWCVSAPIKAGGQPIAITAACQFASTSAKGTGQPRQISVSLLATDLGLSERELQAATGSVRSMAEDALPRVAKLLRRVADTFSEIGQERLDLISRLQHIAEMSQV
jgi:excisionase family DNA binding protein